MHYLSRLICIITHVVILGCSIGNSSHSNDTSRFEILGGKVENGFSPCGYCYASDLDNPPKPVPVWRDCSNMPNPPWFGLVPKEITRMEMAVYFNESGSVDNVVVLRSDYSNVANYYLSRIKKWNFGVRYKNGVVTKYVCRITIETELR